MDQIPRLGKRELICLLLFTCNYVVSVWRGFLFLWVLGMGYVILLWHSLSLPYNYFEYCHITSEKLPSAVHIVIIAPAIMATTTVNVISQPRASDQPGKASPSISVYFTQEKTMMNCNNGNNKLRVF